MSTAADPKIQYVFTSITHKLEDRFANRKQRSPQQAEKRAHVCPIYPIRQIFTYIPSHASTHYEKLFPSVSAWSDQRGCPRSPHI